MHVSDHFISKALIQDGIASRSADIVCLLGKAPGKRIELTSDDD